MARGEVRFNDGDAKGVPLQLDALARQHWEAWWEDVTADFRPYQYVVAGTEHENPMFVQHAYTESAPSENAQRYVVPVEFSQSGTYVFSAANGPPVLTESESRRQSESKGYLMIDEEKHEGAFPMTLHVDAGRHLIRASLSGKRMDKALMIERIRDR